jgi:hypothetical protein
MAVHPYLITEKEWRDPLLSTIFGHMAMRGHADPSRRMRLYRESMLNKFSGAGGMKRPRPVLGSVRMRPATEAPKIPRK